MQANKHTLKNGVRIVMFPMPEVESVTAEVMVGAGARQENPKVNGLAHFLEHMVFKGTKSYPDAQIVSGSVDAVGGYINAHTSKEVVAYYIKSRAKNINLSLDLLGEFITDPILDSGEIEREKGVIYEEISMYEDEPSSKVSEVFESLIYAGRDLGRPVIGSKKSVGATKKKDFEDYRRENYKTDRILVSVAGKFEEKEVVGLVEEALGGLSVTGPASEQPQKYSHMGAAPNFGAPRSESPAKVKGTRLQSNPRSVPQVKVERKKTEQAHIVIAARGNYLGHPDRYKEMVLSSILGGGMSSRLFTEVREKRGLAYSVKSDVEHYTDDGYMGARAGVKLSGVEEAIKVILGEFDKVKTASNISDEELDKAKEYLKGRYALGLEDTHVVAEFYGEQELLQGEIKMLPEIIEGINSVSKEEVAKLAREFFVKERLNLAIIGPYNNASRFEKLLA